ncbi:hypothetical protein I4U23_016454 [Adineta vaga]|nr:hypothetical protein I4U23_016454 [Adineta vaga]
MIENFWKRKGKIEYLVHDLGTLMERIDDESFGIITSCYVWQIMSKEREKIMIKELFRILSKGGLLNMFCHNIPADKLIYRINLLEEMGFICNISRQGLEYWLKSSSSIGYEKRQMVKKEIEKKEMEEKRQLLLRYPELKRVYFFLSSG